MDQQFLIPALLTGALLFSCAEKKPMASAPKDGPATSVSPLETEVNARFGGPTVADSLFFTLERTPCFGQCKAYRIHVYRSGYATFEGRAHVEKEGSHFGTVPKDTMEVLLKEAGRNGFYDLKDRYDSEVTDLPSSIIRVVGLGRDKKVVGRVGTPAEFTRFFTLAEGLLYPINWRPIKPQE